MDKLREEFEKWFLSEMDIDISGMRNSDPDTNVEWPYDSGAGELSAVITVAFKAWQASRASIVVELPEGITTREALDLGYMGDYAAGVDDGIEESAKAIRSIGLSIKGE
ncbi:hypothetical protein HLB02_22065 [Serratia nevei]|nr:hypothetical protein [Serratia nevei]